MPGDDPGSIDSRLEMLFDVHGYKQPVSSFIGTRHDKRTRMDNTLDLLLTSISSTIVMDVSIVTSNHLSDHAFISCRLSCQCIKMPPTPYKYSDIKHLPVDIDAFQQCLRNSTLFSSVTDYLDEYLDEIKHVVGA